MTVFSLQYLLKGIKDRQTRPADFTAAVLRLSAKELEAKQLKDKPQEDEQESKKSLS